MICLGANAVVTCSADVHHHYITLTLSCWLVCCDLMHAYHRDAVVGSSQTNNDAVADGCQTEPTQTSSAACQAPDCGPDRAPEIRYVFWLESVHILAMSKNIATVP